MPRALLVLLDMADDARINILNQARFHGISPSRLLFVPTLPWKEHLHRAPAICDFVLDTFVYGAHTTVSDMLWMAGNYHNYNFNNSHNSNRNHNPQSSNLLPTLPPSPPPPLSLYSLSACSGPASLGQWAFAASITATLTDLTGPRSDLTGMSDGARSDLTEDLTGDFPFPATSRSPSPLQGVISPSSQLLQREMLSLLSDSCKGYEEAALRLAIDAQRQGLGTGLRRRGPASESVPGLGLASAAGSGPGPGLTPDLTLASLTGQGLGTGNEPGLSLAQERELAPRQGITSGQGLAPKPGSVPLALGLRVVGVMRRLILSLALRAPTFDARLMQVR